MEEYCLDLKGQVICIKEISSHCKCFRCRDEEKKENAGENPQEPIHHGQA